MMSAPLGCWPGELGCKKPGVYSLLIGLVLSRKRPWAPLPTPLVLSLPCCGVR